MSAFTHRGINYSNDAFHQQGPPLYSIEDGLTIAAVTFRGPTPKASLFAAELKKQRMPEIDFFGAPIDPRDYRGYSTDDGPTWQSFSIRFAVGTYLGIPYSEDNYALQTVTVPVVWNYPDAPTPFSFQAEFTVQYRSPQTVWSWFETSKPSDTVPRHRIINSKTSPWDDNNIVLIRSQAAFVDSIGDIYDTAIEEAFKVLKTKGFIEAVVDYNVRELIAGRFWQCSAVAAKLISPLMEQTTIIVSGP